MVKADIKRAMISATIALSAVLANPGPAMAQYHQGESPLYNYYYFNQAREQVGYEYDTCNYWGLGKSALDGVRTSDVVTEIYAYCRDGQLSLN